MGFIENISTALQNLLSRNNRTIEVKSQVAFSDSDLGDFTKFLGEFRGTPMGRVNAAEASTTVMRCINFRANHIRNLNWTVEMREENNWTMAIRK